MSNYTDQNLKNIPARPDLKGTLVIKSGQKYFLAANSPTGIDIRDISKSTVTPNDVKLGKTFFTGNGNFAIGNSVAVDTTEYQNPATAIDVMSGKVAYVNGNKIIGTAQPPSNDPINWNLQLTMDQYSDPHTTQYDGIYQIMDNSKPVYDAVFKHQTKQYYLSTQRSSYSGYVTIMGWTIRSSADITTDNNLLFNANSYGRILVNSSIFKFDNYF